MSEVLRNRIVNEPVNDFTKRDQANARDDQKNPYQVVDALTQEQLDAQKSKKSSKK